MKPIEVSAVSYLNARPLVADLEGDPRLRVSSCLPSEASRRLLAGESEVGLVPVVTLISDPDLVWIPGIGIAAEGPVDSVLLFLRRSLEEEGLHLRRRLRVALDPGSRTSQRLARVYLESFRALPRDRIEYLEVDPARALAPEADWDGVLVIGDAAHGREAGPDFVTVDLAEAWTEETGLPFVFAVWGLKRRVLDEHAWLADRFRTARDLGIERLEEIVAGFEGELLVGSDRARRYLETRIRFRLGKREELGMLRFLELVRSQDT